MSAQSRIEPCRADHMPVIEYKRGVTRLLFAGHERRGEVVHHERPFHRDSGQHRPGEHPEAKVRARPEQRRAPGQRPTAIVTTPDTRREQAEGDPDQSQGSVHLVVPFRAFTRFGWAAM